MDGCVPALLGHLVRDLLLGGVADELGYLLVRDLRCFLVDVEVFLVAAHLPQELSVLGGQIAEHPPAD